MMRRLICLLLVLVMSLSVACPALAAVRSPGDRPPVTPPGHRPPSHRPPSSGITLPGSNPKTGDQIMMYVIIMVIALLALVAVVLFSRKFLKK